MRNRAAPTVSLALLALGACGPAEDSAPQSTSGAPREHARAQLVAGVDAVAPGATFELAVRLEMDDHWHVYWTNPGDSGLATEVRLRGPDGFELGEVAFPGPELLVAPGDIVTYGYEHEVHLPATVTVPADPGPGPFRFEADVRWLVCEDGGSCIPGDATVSLELPLADGDPGPGTHADALTANRARLPRSWEQLAPAPQASWAGPADAPRLTLALAGAELEFFPSADPALFLKSRQPSAGRLVLEFEFEPGNGSAVRPRARGLLRVRQGSAEGFYRIDMQRSDG